MVKNEKKKKVSIYSLFEKEKLITFKDDDGNESDILFVKMTQGELSEALKVYNTNLSQERNRIKNNENDINGIKNVINILSKENKVEGIISIEKSYREQIADIFPTPDESDKTEEEKAKERDQMEKKWYSDRESELLKLSDKELEDILIDLRIESLAMMRASIDVNNYSISCMARDPETKERIFQTIDEVFKVKDKTIINKMVETVLEFRENMSDRVVREAAQDSNFTRTGQSQKA